MKTYVTDTPLNSAAITPKKDFVILGGGQDAMGVTQTVRFLGPLNLGVMLTRLSPHVKESSRLDSITKFSRKRLAVSVVTLVLWYDLRPSLHNKAYMFLEHRCSRSTRKGLC